MDLKQVFNATIEALDKRDAEHNARVQDVNRFQETLKVQEKELDERGQKLEADRRAVQEVQDVVAAKKANEDYANELQNTAITLKNKEVELKKYENSLAEIKTGLDQRQDQLTVAQKIQSEREATYKEELKRAFLEEVQSKFPQ